MKWFLIPLVVGFFFIVGVVTAQIEIHGDSNDKVINLERTIKAIRDFVDLDDTPAGISADLCVVGNSAGNGLEFRNCTNGSVTAETDPIVEGRNNVFTATNNFNGNVSIWNKTTINGAGLASLPQGGLIDVDAGNFVGTTGTPIMDISGNNYGTSVGIINNFALQEWGKGSGYVFRSVVTQYNKTEGLLDYGYSMQSYPPSGNIKGLKERINFISILTETNLAGNTGGNFSSIGFKSDISNMLVFNTGDTGTWYNASGFLAKRGQIVSVPAGGSWKGLETNGFRCEGYNNPSDAYGAEAGIVKSRCIYSDGGDAVFDNGDLYVDGNVEAVENITSSDNIHAVGTVKGDRQRWRWDMRGIYDAPVSAFGGVVVGTANSIIDFDDGVWLLKTSTSNSSRIENTLGNLAYRQRRNLSIEFRNEIGTVEMVNSYFGFSTGNRIRGFQFRIDDVNYDSDHNWTIRAYDGTIDCWYNTSVKAENITWMKFKIDVFNATANYYIDDALVGTITDATGCFPDDLLQPIFGIQTRLPANRNMSVDYIELETEWEAVDYTT